jgi:hypothetical protein
MHFAILTKSMKISPAAFPSCYNAGAALKSECLREIQNDAHHDLFDQNSQR